jgi:hypothetical protein
MRGSSVLVGAPDGPGFFDSVSNVAASASAFSLRSSSFSKCRCCLRKAAHSARLAGAPASSIASNASFQASSCSTYKPCSRQYTARSASFIRAVRITVANLVLASQWSGVVG